MDTAHYIEKLELLKEYMALWIDDAYHHQKWLDLWDRTGNLSFINNRLPPFDEWYIGQTEGIMGYIKRAPVTTFSYGGSRDYKLSDIHRLIKDASSDEPLFATPEAYNIVNHRFKGE